MSFAVPSFFYFGPFSLQWPLLSGSALNSVFLFLFELLSSLHDISSPGSFSAHCCLLFRLTRTQLKSPNVVRQFWNVQLKKIIIKSNKSSFFLIFVIGKLWNFEKKEVSCESFLIVSCQETMYSVRHISFHF